MATKLEGPKTRFLPFNKGLENPDVPNDYKTSYIYNDILQTNKLSKLISNFIYMEKDDETKKRFQFSPVIINWIVLIFYWLIVSPARII